MKGHIQTALCIDNEADYIINNGKIICNITIYVGITLGMNFFDA